MRDARGTDRAKPQSAKAAVPTPSEDQHVGAFAGIYQGRRRWTIEYRRMDVGLFPAVERPFNRLFEGLPRGILILLDVGGFDNASIQVWKVPAGDRMDLRAQSRREAGGVSQRLYRRFGAVDADDDFCSCWVLVHLKIP